MPCRAVDAAQHDSQAVDHLLTQGNTGSGVWADAAYRSAEMEIKLRDQKLKSHIHRKGILNDFPFHNWSAIKPISADCFAIGYRARHCPYLVWWIWH